MERMLTEMRCRIDLVGDDRNGRKMIAWGRRIGCADAGSFFDSNIRKVVTSLIVDDEHPSQHAYLLELVDNPQGLLAINRISSKAACAENGESRRRNQES